VALFSIIAICGMAGFSIAKFYFPKFVQSDAAEG